MLTHSGVTIVPNSILVFEGKPTVVQAMQHIPKGVEVRHGFW